MNAVKYSVMIINKTIQSSVCHASILNERNPTVLERTMAERDGNGGNPGPVT